MTNLNHKWLFYLAFYGGSVPITTRKVLPVQRREEYGWVARKGGGGGGGRRSLKLIGILCYQNQSETRPAYPGWKGRIFINKIIP